VHDVVELGLRKTDEPAQPRRWLKRRRGGDTENFADVTPKADGADVRTFLAAVEDARADALGDHEQDVRRLAVSSVRACEQFLKQSRHYYRDRESELTAMIGILRETANLLAGDSTEFGTRIRSTTDRFRAIAEAR
jgi:hypothetical protein